MVKKKRYSRKCPREHYVRYERLFGWRPTILPIQTHINRGRFAGEVPAISRTRKIPRLKEKSVRIVTEIYGEICYNPYMCDKALSSYF